jgi:hypothetical protein
MHDTPARQLFAENYRFLSHGCVRVDGIYDLATWLLTTARSHVHWDREAIADATREGGQKKIGRSSAVAVARVFLDTRGRSAHYFPISVSALRRPVRFFTETGSRGAHRSVGRDSGIVSVRPWLQNAPRSAWITRNGSAMHQGGLVRRGRLGPFAGNSSFVRQRENTV